jgi:hypothetical protein
MRPEYGVHVVVGVMTLFLHREGFFERSPSGRHRQEKDQVFLGQTLALRANIVET